MSQINCRLFTLEFEGHRTFEGTNHSRKRPFFLQIPPAWPCQLVVNCHASKHQNRNLRLKIFSDGILITKNFRYLKWRNPESYKVILGLVFPFTCSFLPSDSSPLIFSVIFLEVFL